jgi:hypothetical protein
MEIIIIVLCILLIFIILNKKVSRYEYPLHIVPGKNKEFINGQEIDFAPPKAHPAFDMYGQPYEEGEMGYNPGVGYTW